MRATGATRTSPCSTRAGEDGADALIEQIAAISGQNERRVYFDALLAAAGGGARP